MICIGTGNLIDVCYDVKESDSKLIKNIVGLKIDKLKIDSNGVVRFEDPFGFLNTLIMVMIECQIDISKILSRYNFEHINSPSSVVLDQLSFQLGQRYQGTIQEIAIIDVIQMIDNLRDCYGK